MLIFLLLPVILAVLNLRGYLEKKYVVYIMMLAVTFMVYARYLPQTLEFLKKVYGSFEVPIDPSLIYDRNPRINLFAI